MSQKLLRKLADKKYREETRLFLVEGKKSIEELLQSEFEVKMIYTTLSELSHFEKLAQAYAARTGTSPEVTCVTEEKLATFGSFRSNNAGIAIVAQRPSLTHEVILKEAQSGFILVLDDVRDPGNLGTIIRTADWFGISHIVTSPTTTDFYNPKTIAATMGSFTRVSVTPLHLPALLKEAHAQRLSILGTFLEGKNIFTEEMPRTGLVVMGSESHGIQKEVEPYITDRLTIPKYGQAESLNVAIATAVVLGALRHPY